MAEYSTNTGSLFKANPQYLTSLYNKISSLVTALNQTSDNASGTNYGWSVGNAPVQPSYTRGTKAYAPSWYSDATAYHNQNYFTGTIPSLPTNTAGIGDLIKGSSLTRLVTYVDQLINIGIQCNYEACSYTPCFGCEYTYPCGGCCES